MAEPLKRTGFGRAIIAGCSLAFILAGCGTVPGPRAPAAAEPPAARAAVELPPPPPRKPTRPPVPSVEATAEPGPSEARLPPADQVVTPSEPHPELDRLIGLDQPQLAELLGEPMQKAESPPATIWRYAAEGCDLDIYFYLDLQSQAMRALHYEVRSHDSTERSAQRCYDELVSERRANADPPAGSDRPR